MHATVGRPVQVGELEASQDEGAVRSQREILFQSLSPGALQRERRWSDLQAGRTEIDAISSSCMTRGAF